MTDRPIEPCNSNEDPEQWAEIAQWEEDRADEAEEQLQKVTRQLMLLRRSINGVTVK